jgi:hypothetical protein
MCEQFFWRSPPRLRVFSGQNAITLLIKLSRHILRGICNEPGAPTSIGILWTEVADASQAVSNVSLDT